MPGTLTLRRLLAPSCTLSLLLAGCGDAGSGSSWAGTIADSAGIQVVQNPEEGMWTDGDAWTVQEELSIGSMDADDAYQFGQITSVDVDEAGNMYVVDTQAQNVRVYGPDGTWLRTLGAPGSGPGELSNSLLGAAIANGELQVVDIGNQRYTRFSLEGEPLGSVRMDFTKGIPFRLDRTSGGRVVAQFRSFNFTTDADTPHGDALVTMGSDGAPVDTITVLPVGMSVQITGGQARIRIFDPEPGWDAGEDGTLVMGMNSAFRIDVLSVDGAVQHVITRPWTAKAVTERDKRVFLDAMADAARQRGGAPPEAIQAFLQQVQFADHYPAFASLLVGPRGSVWVQRIRSGDELAGEEGEFSAQDIGSPEWEVFDAQGRYLGVVTFPGKFQAQRAVGDRFYGVARDEMDVQSVKVYRIVTG